MVDAPKEEEDQESCQLACIGRRPTESLQDVQLPTALPFDSLPAHYPAPSQAPVTAGSRQEPPLLPPQRAEHKVKRHWCQRLCLCYTLMQLYCVTG